MESSKRARSVVVIGALGLGVALGGASCLRVNEDHCMFNGGDTACGERFCVAAVEGGADELAAVGADGCIDAVPRDGDGEIATKVAWVRYGLVDEAGRDDIMRREGIDPETCQIMPPAIDGIAGELRRAAAALQESDRREIHEFNDGLAERIAACGGDETTTGSTTEVADTTEGMTESSESTTGPSGCMEDGDCPDQESPLCGLEGQCVRCNAAEIGGSGDTRCAAKALASGTADVECAEEGPRAGQCVECTEDGMEGCTGVPPLCDVETNTCLPCVEHGQCGGAACNLFTGECLPAEAVVHVGGAMPDFATLGDAVASVGEGAALTVVVHQNDYNEAVTVEGGRALAFLAAEGDLPRWVLNGGGSPQLTVLDGTVLMEGMQLSGNAATADPAVRVTGGRVWVDRGRVIGNDGGGAVAEDGAELVLRNSFVGGSVDVDVLDVRGSMSTILYTTLGAGLGVTTALTCDATASVTLRNSLVMSRSGDAEVTCPNENLEATYTASEAALDGTENVALGDMATTWFQDFNGGNFHLTGSAPDALQTAALWSVGDPPTDIDGDDRPTTDGTADDYAGADVP